MWVSARQFAMVSVENAATFSHCVAVFHVFCECFYPSAHISEAAFLLAGGSVITNHHHRQASSQSDGEGRRVVKRATDTICVCGMACNEMHYGFCWSHLNELKIVKAF